MKPESYLLLILLTVAGCATMCPNPSTMTFNAQIENDIAASDVWCTQGNSNRFNECDQKIRRVIWAETNGT